MKKFLIILFLMIIFVFNGCSHKSNSEQIDIEQFRCQDSIKTVFDVLGETEINPYGIEGKRYEYDDLNIYGYKGKAVFKVRDNEDTISSFYCSLELNENEFEDILSQLMDEYGKYEKSEYTNQIAYVWEIPDTDAKEIGYNRISFSDYGDKKAIIDFEDEWSMYTDEAYYEYLEEKNQKEILSSTTYNIGSDEFCFSFSKEDNEYVLSILCSIDNKNNAFHTHFALNSIMNADDDELKEFVNTYGFTYCILIGDGTVLLNTNNNTLLSNSDGERIEFDDYFSDDFFANEFEESNYGTQVLDFLVDFMENY